MAVTLHDIASHAGVSVSTVSRVLNNKSDKYRISDQTVLQVMAAAKKLKYRPNQLARGLRLKRTHTLGLVVPDVSNPFFAHITRVIQTCSYDFGYSLIVCNTDENIETEEEHIELLRSKGVDGIIIMTVGTRKSHIEKLLKEKLPIVLLDRSFKDLNSNAVVVDNYMGSYQAVEYLINQGHKRIAIIQGLQNTSTNTDRVKGYRDALTNYKIEIDENLVVGNDFRKENGYIQTKILLNLNCPPTAIFTTSDLITLGALKAIFEKNIKIPEDISLISFDDIDFAPYLVSPLTVVSQPRELMGELAVKLLLDDLSSIGKKEKQIIVLKPKLIKRRSVKSIPQYKILMDESLEPYSKV